jgi:hypothetical protein
MESTISSLEAGEIREMKFSFESPSSDLVTVLSVTVSSSQAGIVGANASIGFIPPTIIT